MAISLVKTEGKLSATLLVIGCCVGAGMIGLPVMSALAGFIPTTLAMVLCYFFAVGTGLLIVEATLWFEGRVNLITMARFALGKAGKVITWILFLFLFYCIFVAYIDGGGQLFSSLLSSVLHHPVPRAVGILTCVGFVGTITYAGTQAVSYVTRAFLLCLAASYFTLVSLALPNVKVDQLLYMDKNAVLATIPILLICFGYQNLLPTLTYFVKRNISTL
ncbi:MAG TPA: aromatic amino acid transport family protein, partial [Chlamydiales bacterium]|nr:aromatic amino acid transport family protein [Chlamydiales bacterium]